MEVRGLGVKAQGFRCQDQDQDKDQDQDQDQDHDQDPRSRSSPQRRTKTAKKKNFSWKKTKTTFAEERKRKDDQPTNHWIERMKQCVRTMLLEPKNRKTYLEKMGKGSIG